MALIPFQLFPEADKRNFDFVVMIHAHSRLHLDLGICRAVGVLYCFPGMAWSLPHLETNDHSPFLNYACQSNV